MRPLIIAIDGPAASGKSTTARLVAKKLGYLYIDTGAMYRALTVKALEKNIKLTDETALTELAEKSKIELKSEDDKYFTFLDGIDISDKIREPQVSRNVSVVCMPKGVRKRMVALQRQLGKNGGVVLEGRDIGTVVFPNADLKVFMSASIEERAQRRKKELEAKGFEVDTEQLKEEIRLRDKKDSNRANSPLQKAEDALYLDTTDLTIDEQVYWIVDKAKKMISRQKE